MMENIEKRGVLKTQQTFIIELLAEIVDNF